MNLGVNTIKMVLLVNKCVVVDVLFTSKSIELSLHWPGWLQAKWSILLCSTLIDLIQYLKIYDSIGINYN
jgi:hypothetical protein